MQRTRSFAFVVAACFAAAFAGCKSKPPPSGSAVAPSAASPTAPATTSASPITLTLTSADPIRVSRDGELLGDGPSLSYVRDASCDVRQVNLRYTLDIASGGDTQTYTGRTLSKYSVTEPKGVIEGPDLDEVFRNVKLLQASGGGLPMLSLSGSGTMKVEAVAADETGNEPGAPEGGNVGSTALDALNAPAVSNTVSVGLQVADKE